LLTSPAVAAFYGLLLVNDQKPQILHKKSDENCFIRILTVQLSRFIKALRMSGVLSYIDRSKISRFITSFPASSLHIKWSV
jgi:hypothetical protein